MGEVTKFAWLPVRIAAFDGREWHYTGERAWLRRVRVVETVWGDRFHVEVRQ